MMDRPKLIHRWGIMLGLCEPPQVPPYGWSYFDHLVAVYVTLNANDVRAAAVIAKAVDRPYGMTWGDVFLLENVILSLQPDEVVCRDSWIVRERFRQIAGPAMYSRYVDSGIPVKTDTPGNVALLRADLSRVLDCLHWYYALIPIREHTRKSLTESCIRWVIFYTFVLLAALYPLHHAGWYFSETAACALYFGLIGGFVSSQRRMQSIPTDGDPLISVFGFDNAGYYLWLSPLLGAVFAAILALLFISGILTGSLFPSFQGPTTHYKVLREMLPLAGADYAKLFVWCFLAGFAERMVPDSLDRLASKLDPGNGVGSSGPPVAAADHLSPLIAKGELKAAPLSASTLDDAMHIGYPNNGDDGASDSGGDGDTGENH
jgi:hypothetical protein